MTIMPSIFGPSSLAEAPVVRAPLLEKSLSPDEKHPDASYLPLYNPPTPPPAAAAPPKSTSSSRIPSRVVYTLCTLLSLFVLASHFRMIPPNGGTSLDMRVAWSLKPVPKDLDAPWWKVAFLELDIELDLITGKGDKFAQKTAQIEFGNWPWAQLKTGSAAAAAAVVDGGGASYHLQATTGTQATRRPRGTTRPRP